jgi:hypothetical protein
VIVSSSDSHLSDSRLALSICMEYVLPLLSDYDAGYDAGRPIGHCVIRVAAMLDTRRITTSRRILLGVNQVCAFPKLKFPQWIAPN